MWPKVEIYTGSEWTQINCISVSSNPRDELDSSLSNYVGPIWMRSRVDSPPPSPCNLMGILFVFGCNCISLPNARPHKTSNSVGFAGQFYIIRYENRKIRGGIMKREKRKEEKWIKESCDRDEAKCLWVEWPFFCLAVVKAVALGVVCQLCQSTEVVIKAEQKCPDLSQHYISTPLSFSLGPLVGQCNICDILVLLPQQVK